MQCSRRVFANKEKRVPKVLCFGDLLFAYLVLYHRGIKRGKTKQTAMESNIDIETLHWQTQKGKYFVIV